MNPRAYKILDDTYPYFVTTGIKFGLPIFSNSMAVNIIVENFRFLQNNRGVSIIAYVIMENHLHAILQARDLGAKIGQFKSYSARRIIDLFKENGNTEWLRRLELVKNKNKKDRKYQLWEEGFLPKQIISDAMMIQKIEYIHNNPVKRGYVAEPGDWLNSSARVYNNGSGPLSVDVFRL